MHLRKIQHNVKLPLSEIVLIDRCLYICIINSSRWSLCRTLKMVCTCKSMLVRICCPAATPPFDHLLSLQWCKLVYSALRRSFKVWNSSLYISQLTFRSRHTSWYSYWTSLVVANWTVFIVQVSRHESSGGSSRLQKSILRASATCHTFLLILLNKFGRNICSINSRRTGHLAPIGF